MAPIRKHDYYHKRSGVSSKFRAAIEGRKHLVVYGPAGQGKTTELLASLDLAECCIVDCRSDLKKRDIYRILLSSAGYSVIRETRRKGKAGASATVKFFGSGLSGDGSREIESTASELTADLNNGTEVAFLLSEVKAHKFLLLNNFDYLERDVQNDIARELAIFYEWSALRFVIVGGWIDPYRLERLSADLTGKIVKLFVPFWSSSDLQNHISAIFEKDVIGGPGAIERIIDLSGGDVSLAVHLAQVWAEQFSVNANVPVEGFDEWAKRYLAERFRDINFERLVEFAASSRLEVLFSRKEPVVLTKTKTVSFVDEKQMRDLLGDASTSQIFDSVVLDQTGRISTDGNGRITYSLPIKTIESRRLDYKLPAGLWILRRFFQQKSGKGTGSIGIAKLIGLFERRFLTEALPYRRKKLEQILLSVVQVQAEIGLTPPVISYDAQKHELSASNPHIKFFFEQFGVGRIFDELDDEIEWYYSARRKVKKGNCIGHQVQSQQPDVVLDPSEKIAAIEYPTLEDGQAEQVGSDT